MLYVIKIVELCYSFMENIFMYIKLTFSIENVHSLSSCSFVRRSLNNVKKNCLFSGTGQITMPRKGSFIVGSHGKVSLTKRRLFRVKTTTNLSGVLKESS